MKKIVRNIPKGLLSVVIGALIVYASLDNNPFDVQHVSLFKGADKVVHAIMYFSLAVALIFDLAKARYPRKVSLLILVLCAFVAFGFSIVMELLQDAMQLGRTASVADGVANLIGVMLGLMFMRYVFLQRFYQYMR